MKTRSHRSSRRGGATQKKSCVSEDTSEQQRNLHMWAQAVVGQLRKSTSLDTTDQRWKPLAKTSEFGADVGQTKYGSSNKDRTKGDLFGMPVGHNTSLRGRDSDLIIGCCEAQKSGKSPLTPALGPRVLPLAHSGRTGGSTAGCGATGRFSSTLPQPGQS